MDSCEIIDLEQICIIVNFGLASKILHAAKHDGISGGTVLLGRGTVHNRILEFFCISDVRKEIVLMVAGRHTAEQVLEKLNHEFKFERPNHGIAFTTSVSLLAGTRSCKSDISGEERGVEDMYQMITVIVDKGKAEEVIDAATSAGSSGGTIINARGSGVHETSRLFAMDIEPEKELVMILSEKEKTEAIVLSVRNALKLDEPGMGILYVQDVNKTYGLYKKNE